MPKGPLAENFLIIAGMMILSTLVYLHYVFAVFSSIDELFEKSLAFTVSALSLGAICSTIGFKRPIVATFLIAASAPVISFLGYFVLGLTMAMAGVPNGGFNIARIIVFLLTFSISYGTLATLGCLVGLRILAAASRALGSTAMLGGDAVTAAKISAAATAFGALVTMLGAIVASWGT